MNPIQQLAQELKEAAQKYTQATGKQFTAEFLFTDFQTINDLDTKYVCTSVTVTTTEEAQA